MPPITASRSGRRYSVRRTRGVIWFLLFIPVAVMICDSASVRMRFGDEACRILSKSGIQNHTVPSVRVLQSFTKAHNIRKNMPAKRLCRRRTIAQSSVLLITLWPLLSSVLLFSKNPSNSNHSATNAVVSMAQSSTVGPSRCSPSSSILCHTGGN
jgi:hypothetical protein